MKTILTAIVVFLPVFQETGVIRIDTDERKTVCAAAMTEKGLLTAKHCLKEKFDSILESDVVFLDVPSEKKVKTLPVECDGMKIGRKVVIKTFDSSLLEQKIFRVEIKEKGYYSMYGSLFYMARTSEVKDEDETLTKGVSGSPVFDETGKKIVGILSGIARNGKKKTLFLSKISCTRTK